jgi:hypothetical protein
MNPWKRRLGLLLAGLASASSLLLLAASPMLFMSTDGFAGLLGGIFGASVDERYAGGPVLASFRDPVNDDAGSGGLPYPKAADNADSAGSAPGRFLDLVGFAVREPVTAPVIFIPERGFWQFDYSLSSLGPAAIHHFIDVDGPGGRVDSPAGEVAAFDPAHAWDFMVEVDVARGKAWLSDAAGSYRKEAVIYKMADEERIVVRVPLFDSGIEPILDGRSTWHYVVVGAWDDFAPGRFRPVGPGLSPAYDSLAPKGAEDGAAATRPVEAKGVAGAAARDALNEG